MKFLSLFVLATLPVVCTAQSDKTENNLSTYQTTHYPWLSLGVNVGRQFNYAHVLNYVTIPSSGDSEFVAVPVTNFGLRIQREFDHRWLWRGGVDISEYGLRVRTLYSGGGQGRTTYFRQQTQVHFSVQYYLFGKSSAHTRPYFRLGTLASVYVGPPTQHFTTFSRQVSGSPRYYDRIISVRNRFAPGLVTAVGFSRRIRSGFMFDLALVAYRGLAKLADINYRVARETESGPPEELLNTKIINRGSFIGFEGSIYLPPFRYRKILKQLNQ